MKVAVTGASGHIGNCLVREILKKGDQVKVLVHNFDNDLARMDVQLIRGNLLDKDSLNKLCEGVDVVFHLAARIVLDNRHREEVFAVNVTGTKNMIVTAQRAGVKKFIHFSSIDAFQMVQAGKKLDESTPLVTSQNNLYAFTKAESERLVLNAAKNGFNATILSPTAVIGPYDFRGSFLGKALIQIYENKIPMLVSGGYNWVDVRDVVDAAIQSVEFGRKGEKHIIPGNYCSLSGLAKMISEISGKRTPKLLAPVWMVKMACPFFQLYSFFTGKQPVFTAQSIDLLTRAPKNIVYDKAKTELNYSPRLLDQTLRDTFNWYIENKILN